jgi:hypothetical protein
MEGCLDRESVRDASTVILDRVSGIPSVQENLGMERWITRGNV